MSGLEVEQLTALDSEYIVELTDRIDPEPLSPLVDLGEAVSLPSGAEVPEVVIVFELDHQQYASAREHFDHLIDNHRASGFDAVLVRCSAGSFFVGLNLAI